MFTTTSANGGDPVVFFGFGRPGAFGLEITPECIRRRLRGREAVVEAS